MQVNGIDHVVLRVGDLDVATRFYSQVLGCPLERRQEAIGMVQLRAGGALIDLVAVDGPLGRRGGAAPGAEGRNLDHLCLRIAGFEPERIRSELAAHGIAADAAVLRYGAAGEGPSIYLRDPDGNGVELRG
ncbi:catechol 2,3-dioxygenase-like lactoylglutathione lyase family enzyme [Ancylobacter sp. 3268]|uniref:VOC family protein n=1 Tax=Ancylobacter sp. 3268 TaxID=2817752 RepID=UPI00285D7206|nr:VOC family protein [Ancylobacter sp. 3268]MDR6951746.1 catechol 2,3-dioxygenase-like lactoylglutathione lyase family enzyme [Ancylobacter sp. 3268]